jgi:hypothetical protein
MCKISNQFPTLRSHFSSVTRGITHIRRNIEFSPQAAQVSWLTIERGDTSQTTLLEEFNFPRAVGRFPLQILDFGAGRVY